VEGWREPGRGFGMLSEGEIGESGRVETLTSIMKHPLTCTCTCQTPAKWPAAPSYSQQHPPLRPAGTGVSWVSPKNRPDQGRNRAKPS